ncbi:MAG: hypothetical protein IJ724_02240 [Muribaculaceae bacterium]|nr:hypothetical protein [Muribaculaceae bacterium]MBR1725459.1 hypothetical protein [Muribaculaceae bacterium]
MKKIIFVLTTALILGMGTMSAQNKFKAAKSKAPATKTEAKAPATKSATAKTEAKQMTASKVTAAKEVSATKVTAAKAQPMSANKATTKTATKKTAATAKPIDASTFNGTWANSYSDGIGGMVTDYLDLTVDTTTGVAKGMYKDENGDGRAVSGKLQGNRLVMTYDADGDEFATINIINANTLKLEGFTGTFKRVEDMNAAPKVDIAVPVTEAPVDPAYQEVKKYLENDK